jgi:GNAT superfamily N-acetyltransferase
MPLPDDLRMRTATETDVPVIAALRDSVGWAVHEWALRAVLQPPDARCLVVTDDLDRIVGVGSGISYGELGFVGNMVVVEDHRRRGVGAAVLDAIVSFLSGERGCTRLELNATAEGRPLYEAHGFETIGMSAFARIGRDVSLAGDPSAAIRAGGTDDLDDLVAYDRPRFGGDRRAIFEALLGGEIARFVVAERDGALVGYACAQLEGPRIGPMVADDPSIAEAVLREAFDLLPDVEELRLNLPPENREGADWMRGLGVEVELWDGRMARGPQVPRRPETIYAMTVGPLG